MENKVDIDTIVENGVVNYSNSFSECIDDAFGIAEEKLVWLINNIGDIAADALADIHRKYGIEESDENYEKVKAGVVDSIKYNMDYLIEKLIERIACKIWG